MELEKVKHLWETWDICVLVICSLGIQMFLTLLAPYRKRCASSILSFVIWLLYLAADSVALFTIGLIANSQDKSDEIPGRKADLLAFWAPFLLLHLGGPDTITALALEDNELWHRHALQLVTQLAVTIYVFVRSMKRSHLWLPMVLMFVDGSIKYFERTCALYFASMENFRDSQRTKPEAGPNYARLMEEYSSATSAHLPTDIIGEAPLVNVVDDFIIDNRSHIGNTENSKDAVENAQDAKEAATPNDSDDMILDAYRFYDKFKGLLADSFINLKDRDESRAFFLGKQPHEAFRIVQIELNFMYDVFYTKVFLLQRKRGYARLICFASLMGSLVIFCFFTDKSNYQAIDVGITFALLIGAITLDFLASLMFVLSDWCIITARKNTRLKPLKILWRLSSGARSLSHRRWSESISQYDLLKRCLESPSLLFDIIPIRKVQDLWIGWRYVCNNRTDPQLVEFIVYELQSKALVAHSTQANQELCSARGNLVFLNSYSLVAEYLRPWTVDIDYDESLLTWHFATCICYWTCSKKEKEEKHVKISKTLSDYMSFLVLRQQALLSTIVGTSDIRFDDTYAEVKKFMLNSSGIVDIDQFCAKILKVKTPVQPSVAKGDKSKSVLFDSCCLAKQLNLLKEKKWIVMSNVWLELLCYTAVRCSTRSHVALLSKGGELVTLVWLLMAHLGIGERFRQYQGFGWTKLIIDK